MIIYTFGADTIGREYIGDKGLAGGGRDEEDSIPAAHIVLDMHWLN